MRPRKSDVSEVKPPHALADYVMGPMLNLWHGNFKAKEIPEIAEFINQRSDITILRAGASTVGDVGAEAFADMLKINRTLTSIDLSENDIESKGAIALAAALKDNQKLVSLDINNNDIGDEGVKALADMLKINQTLTSIDLSDSDMDEEGVKALADMLEINQKLTSINLNGNDIGDDTKALKALADMLKINQTLTSIDLSANGIESKGAIALAATLKKNQTLTVLKINDNEMRDEGTKALAEMLKINRTLTSIDLSENYISSIGVKELADALKVNQALTSLDLSVNCMGNTGAVFLAEALRINQTLTLLGVRSNEVSKNNKESLKRIISDNELFSMECVEYKLDCTLMCPELLRYFPFVLVNLIQQYMQPCRDIEIKLSGNQMTLFGNLRSKDAKLVQQSDIVLLRKVLSASHHKEDKNTVTLQINDQVSHLSTICVALKRVFRDIETVHQDKQHLIVIKNITWERLSKRLCVMQPADESVQPVLRRL
jgi:Ran GTPase-activating protein (RanGAP) involved in mRNA processing and transport